MKLQQLFSAAAGLALVACVATPSFAFMASGDDSSNVAGSGAAGIVAELKAEVAAGKTQCSDLLDKFNQAIAVIDTQLDAGVADELSHLSARDSIVQMRSDLPCLGEKLALMQNEMDENSDGTMPPVGDGQVVSDTLLSEQTVGSTVVPDGMTTGTSSFGSNAGNFSGGGGGGAGGSFGGGGGFGLLAAGGIAAAIAIPVSTSNNPGTVVSPSTP